MTRFQLRRRLRSIERRRREFDAQLKKDMARARAMTGAAADEESNRIAAEWGDETTRLEDERLEVVTQDLISRAHRLLVDLPPPVDKAIWRTNPSLCLTRKGLPIVRDMVEAREKAVREARVYYINTATGLVGTLTALAGTLIAALSLLARSSPSIAPAPTTDTKGQVAPSVTAPSAPVAVPPPPAARTPADTPAPPRPPRP